MPARKHKRGSRHRLSGRKQQWLIQIVLFLGMLVIFYIFLRYITEERASESTAIFPISESKPGRTFS